MGHKGPFIKAYVHRGCEVPNPNANQSIIISLNAGMPTAPLWESRCPRLLLTKKWKTVIRCKVNCIVLDVSWQRSAQAAELRTQGLFIRTLTSCNGKFTIKL